MKVCIIDNYDSFTYNIVHLLQKLKAEVIVFKNDCLIQDILSIKPDKILLSPGPGFPSESGVCHEVIKEFAGIIDILGICLGHQIIAEFFASKVDYAKSVMHGKTSKIIHTNKGIFKNLPQKFKVARYHSLAVTKISNDLEITATSELDNEIMGLKHKKFNIEGIQFHPESFLSEYGNLLLSNFLYEKPDNI